MKRISTGFSLMRWLIQFFVDLLFYATLDFGMVSGSQQLVSLVKWINAVLPNFNLPLDTTEEELRARLRDGSVLCSILDNLVPGCRGCKGWP